MPRGRIVTGDHARLPVRLRKAGATFDASGATIVAAIVTENHSDKLSGDVAQSSVATGADWANSLIIVEFPPAETGALTLIGDAKVEIEVTENGEPQTAFVDVEIIKGHI